MKCRLSTGAAFFAALLLALPAAAQLPEAPPPKLPDGRSQYDAILAEDHKKNLEDLARMMKLLEEVKAELDENKHFALSLQALKKLEEVESLSRKVRNRMRRR